MGLNVNEIVMSEQGDNGVITRIDGQGIYVLWEDGSCGVAKGIDLYTTGKRIDIVYFLLILQER